MSSILITDDDEDDILLLKEAFNTLRLQHNVNTLTDGQLLIEHLRALQALKKVLPDLILLDINMPRMNGIEALNKIHDQKLCPDTAIVVYSTMKNNYEKEKCLLYGAKAVVTKGFKTKDILRFVKLLDEYLMTSSKFKDKLWHF